MIISHKALPRKFVKIDIPPFVKLLLAGTNTNRTPCPTRKMNNEQKFWRSLLETRNPGWKLHVPEGDQLEGLAEYDVAIYVVDTSTGWTTAGMLKAAEFGRVAQAVGQAVGQAAKSMRKIGGGITAGIWKVLGASPQPGANSPEAHEALVSACADMSLTKTFLVVQQQTGGFAGHWVYLVYRLRSGERIGRPAYFGRRSPGLMDRGDLVLLCHKRSLTFTRRQHGHRGSVASKAAAIRSRKVVMDDGTWRCVRWAAARLVMRG